MPARKTKKKPTTAQLRKVLGCTLDLFKTKSRWTAGAWARIAPSFKSKYVRGVPIKYPKSPAARSWCLEGGLMKCSPDFPKAGDNESHSAIYDAVVKVLQPLADKQAGAGAGVNLFFLNDGLIDAGRPANGGLPGVRKLLRAGIAALDKKAPV